MRGLTLLAICVISLVMGMASFGHAGQEPAKGEARKPSVVRGANHLIFPVETPLQRLLCRRHDAKVFVAINGANASEKSEIEQTILEPLRHDLSQVAAPGDIVQFSILFGKDSKERDPTPMKKALNGLVNDLQLQSDPADDEWGSAPLTWKEKVAQIDEDLPADAHGDEAGLGGDTVMVYPVCTHLGRYLTGADAYVDFTTELTGDSDKDKAVLDKICSSAAKLKFARKKRIDFRFHHPAQMAGGDDKKLMRELEAFTKSLGFQKFGWTLGS